MGALAGAGAHRATRANEDPCGYRFIERIERYDHVFPKYAEQGIAVFAYDQRGESVDEAPSSRQDLTLSTPQALDAPRRTRTSTPRE